MRIPYISLLAAGAIALGGCAYDGFGSDYGYGYGSPYYGGGYGYGSPSVSIGVGYGSGYGGYGYGSPYYGGYYGSSYGGYGYGSPYGWYDNYYYPGTGYYVYDSYRQPHTMTTGQRSYWTSRSPALRTTTATRTNVRPNWSGFNSKAKAARQQARDNRDSLAEQRRQNRHNP